jgi:hypothetical protein
MVPSVRILMIGACGAGEILGFVPFPAVAEGEKEIAVASERQPAAEKLEARSCATLEDHFFVGHRLVALFVTCPEHLDGGRRLLALQIGDVDEPAVGKFWIERDVEQSDVAT